MPAWLEVLCLVRAAMQSVSSYADVGGWISQECERQRRWFTRRGRSNSTQNISAVPEVEIRFPACSPFGYGVGSISELENHLTKCFYKYFKFTQSI